MESCALPVVSLVHVLALLENRRLEPLLDESEVSIPGGLQDSTLLYQRVGQRTTCKSTPLPAIFTGNSPPGEDFALRIAAALLLCCSAALLLCTSCCHLSTIRWILDAQLSFQCPVSASLLTLGSAYASLELINKLTSPLATLKSPSIFLHSSSDKDPTHGKRC